MTAQNWQQKYLTNPITTNVSGDLFYCARSPYGIGNDAVISWDDFASQFVIPYQVQINAFNVGIDSGAADAYVVTVDPVLPFYTNGLAITFSPLNANATTTPTVDVSGLGAKTVKGKDLSALLAGDFVVSIPAIIIYNISDDSFELLNPQASNSVTPQDVQYQNFVYRGDDTGIANAYVIPNTPEPIVTLIDGLKLSFKPSNANTGASTIDVGTGTNPLVLNGNLALPANSLLASSYYEITYDANYSAWILLNPSTSGGGITAAQIQNQAFTYTTDTPTVTNAYTLAYSPAIVSLTDGMILYFVAKSVNTGAATADVGTGANPIVYNDGTGSTALLANSILNNEYYQIQWNGIFNAWMLLNPSASPGAAVTPGQIQNQTFVYCGTDTGVADAYVIDNVASPIGGAALGMKFSFLAGNSNTGAAATMSVGASGVNNLVLSDNSILPANAIVAGEYYEIALSGTFGAWVLLNPSGAAIGSFLPLSGGTMSGDITFSGTNYLDGLTGVKDANGNLVVEFGAGSGSAVNFLLLANNATGLPPVINAEGSDTNIDLNIGGKGTGAVNILGASTNSTAPSGYVGEVISSVISSPVSLVNNTAKDLTSISLTAGDWDVWGNVFFGSGGTLTSAYCWLNTTSATQPATQLINGLGATVTQCGFSVPSRPFTVASTTTVYISGVATFGVSATMLGGIYARRIR